MQIQQFVVKAGLTIQKWIGGGLKEIKAGETFFAHELGLGVDEVKKLFGHAVFAVEGDIHEIAVRVVDATTGQEVPAPSPLGTQAEPVGGQGGGVSGALGDSTGGGQQLAGNPETV